MFIRDIFAQKKPVLSFEVFPPKKDSGLDNVISAVDELSKMPIDYMSVTYGAGAVSYTHLVIFIVTIYIYTFQVIERKSVY